MLTICDSLGALTEIYSQASPWLHYCVEGFLEEVSSLRRREMGRKGEEKGLLGSRSSLNKGTECVWGLIRVGLLGN